MTAIQLLEYVESTVGAYARRLEDDLLALTEDDYPAVSISLQAASEELLHSAGGYITFGLDVMLDEDESRVDVPFGRVRKVLEQGRALSEVSVTRLETHRQRNAEVRAQPELYAQTGKLLTFDVRADKDYPLRVLMHLRELWGEEIDTQNNVTYVLSDRVSPAMQKALAMYAVADWMADKGQMDVASSFRQRFEVLGDRAMPVQPRVRRTKRSTHYF